jgi:hypothetical protein
MEKNQRPKVSFCCTFKHIKNVFLGLTHTQFWRRHCPFKELIYEDLEPAYVELPAGRLGAMQRVLRILVPVPFTFKF